MNGPADRDVLAARITAAMALHNTEFGNEFGDLECSVCRDPWPCPTVVALNGDTGLTRHDAEQLLHTLGAWLAGPDSVQYQVTGDWGVDGADSAEQATARVARLLAAYPHCGAEASQRVAIEFPDGGEYYGPWHDLGPADQTEEA